MQKQKNQKSAWKIVCSIAISGTILLQGAVTAAWADSDYANHWAKEEIGKMVALRLYQGDEQGLIKPDRVMTRAEFMTLLVRAFDFQVNFIKAPDIKDIVDDVPSNAWYTDDLIRAAHTFLPIEHRIFHPDEGMTREVMAQWVMAAYTHKSNEATTITTENVDFTDAGEIDPLYVEAVKQAASLKWLTGYDDGTFQPKAQVTRAQAAVIVARMLQTLPENLRKEIIPYQYHSRADQGKWDATPQGLILRSKEDIRAFEEKWRDPSSSLSLLDPTQIDFEKQAVVALIGYPSSSSNPPLVTSMVRQDDQLTIHLEKKTGVIETADITGIYRFYRVSKEKVYGIKEVRTDLHTITVSPEK
ncbi:hypothetical protein GJ688_12325 [Heliobacillus mobilis]|uniref:SLH domain-containing protein n=1 Tax=Heliobacterium mobile TaxID=28064 RepID=A0A6I3SLF9_HELMO|nr:S-layer homology domain-containing protein [Heliobacterium mobile]MTV49759.1 hypothetical protein [Heliobacterium mobile]